MNRTFNNAANHKEAENWDIKQQINLTPGQRQKITRELKKRFYGESVPDARTSRKVVKKIKF